MTTIQSAPSKPVVNHLWPSMTHWRSPSSRRAVVDMTVGLEPACSGSVMAKHDRAAPSRTGCKNRARWSSLACASSSSMLPMSGAWPFVAQWPSGLRPSASETRPNSGSGSPAPPWSLCSARFHNPSARALPRASPTASASAA